MDSTNPDNPLMESLTVGRSALERLGQIIEGQRERTDDTLAAIARELREAADLLRQPMTPEEDIDFEIGETDV